MFTFLQNLFSKPPNDVPDGRVMQLLRDVQARGWVHEDDPLTRRGEWERAEALRLITSDGGWGFGCVLTDDAKRLLARDAT